MLLGDVVDASVILGVVLINAVIGFVQESRAEKALDALMAMVRTQATVVRDGARHRIPSDELVPGDVVVLETGDKVPADLRFVSTHELYVDESALTGESVPVEKSPIELPRGTHPPTHHTPQTHTTPHPPPTPPPPTKPTPHPTHPHPHTPNTPPP